MPFQVNLLRLPLEPLIASLPSPAPTNGATVQFTGTVRQLENGSPISALIYEAYEPMAYHLALDLFARLARIHPVHSALMLHRLGTIPVGAAAIHLRIESPHRAEALAFTSAFLDQLKQDIPIWKTGSLP